MAVEWKAIRQALRVRRAELHMEVNELRTKSGIGRTTIYRIENIADLPDHVMDLETVEALSNAMGLSLSELFLRIEGLQMSEPTRHTPAPLKAGAHGAAVQKELSDIDRTFLLAIGETLAESFDRSIDKLIAARTPTTSAAERQSLRRSRRRKVG